MLNNVACELWSEATRSSACAASEALASDRENWSLNQGISHLFDIVLRICKKLSKDVLTCYDMFAVYKV